ncbi:uncharacterized protein LOC117580738 [Drosophila guanche]|uniref:Uncharacterized protein n=1 Tax=Drosophila guanche TaxID=7266 RepID=A0A3B0JVD4_DROGU|nr:uncharacterized protein LOC117580738 [Drosophila guanche]SPP77679.1 Hypothetical predicted protein [Drosophila guanche]
MSRNLGCLLGLLLVAFLHSGQAIVGVGAARDLVLTPKQGMQLTGKRIYYEEQEHVRERDVRPWEHTLKHVTYVTLFTDAAAGAAAGNLSQLHEYHEFLQTPYVPVDPLAQSATAATPSRFGDIITLASGRLEQLPNNGSYRFVEGTGSGTGTGTGTGHGRALWQVQRIRHRDGGKGRHYHYEIRFSVTPLMPTRKAAPSYQMSYIQKESDYPGSFARLAHEALGIGGFTAQRRNDRERERERQREREREQSQATFIHGIFQPPPSPKLNIGEYLTGGAAAPHPHPMPLPGGGLFQLGLGLGRSNFIAPTTFRPNYPTVRLGPEHPGLDTTAIRYPEAPPESAAPTPAAAAAVSGGVTHHFHHHFYVAPGSGSASSTQSPPRAASGYYHYQRQQQQQQQQQQRQPVHFPSSSSGSHESYESNEDPEQELLIRSPQIFGQASKYQTAKLPPLIIYAAAGISQPNEHEDKSFVQSEPLEETVYRYSEPDPLYVHQNPIDVLHLDEQRLEFERDKDSDRDREQEEPEQEQEQPEEEQKRASSLDQPEVATTTEVPPATTTTSEPPKTTTTASSSSSSSSSTVATPTTPAATVSSASSFVSTSTHFSPLRNLSRYRTTPRITAGRSTTTTTTSTTSSTAAPALSKWARRRKEQQDSKAKSSDRHEAYVNSTTAAPAAAQTTAATPTSTLKPAVAPLRSDVVEVLTQKSVSRSVSIKVGDNGEEIPFIVDDDENEVSFT